MRENRVSPWEELGSFLGLCRSQVLCTGCWWSEDGHTSLQCWQHTLADVLSVGRCIVRHEFSHVEGTGPGDKPSFSQDSACDIYHDEIQSSEVRIHRITSTTECDRVLLWKMMGCFGFFKNHFFTVIVNRVKEMDVAVQFYTTEIKRKKRMWNIFFNKTNSLLFCFR